MSGEQKKDRSRREFLGWGLCGGASGVSLLALSFTVGRMPMPALLPERSSRFRIGDRADIPPGTAVFYEEEQAFVIADTEGIFAMSAVCTHLGCVVQRNRSGFVCPCHGSRYDTMGHVLHGPAPRSLDWFRVGTLPGGGLFVDRGQVVPAGTKLKV